MIEYSVFTVVSILCLVVILVPSSLASTAKKPAPTFYVSIGDSYAADIRSRPGPTGRLRRQGRRPGGRRNTFSLRNFGCGGATTTSMMTTIGCPDAIASPGAVSYPKKTSWRRPWHSSPRTTGRIGLITVSIGGNDLDGTADNVAPIAANIAKISARLRAAAGKTVPIIGLTYPDVVLAEWLSGTTGVATAQESITAFQDIINPDWKAAYASSRATFVDITAAFGAYVPLSQTVNYSTYGQTPYAVVEICTLTGACSAMNIHPRMPVTP